MRSVRKEIAFNILCCQPGVECISSTQAQKKGPPLLLLNLHCDSS